MANIVTHCAVVEELRSTIAQWQLYMRPHGDVQVDGVYTPRLRTDETGSTSTARSKLTWLVSGVDNDQTSTTAPRSLTDLPADGWPSSTTVPHPDGVVPSRMVDVSASVNLPLHRKVQKFSSGTGSPGWSRKKGHKMLVCVCVCARQIDTHLMAAFPGQPG